MRNFWCTFKAYYGRKCTKFGVINIKVHARRMKFLFWGKFNTMRVSKKHYFLAVFKCLLNNGKFLTHFWRKCTKFGDINIKVHSRRMRFLFLDKFNTMRVFADEFSNVTFSTENHIKHSHWHLFLSKLYSSLLYSKKDKHYLFFYYKIKINLQITCIYNWMENVRQWI